MIRVNTEHHSSLEIEILAEPVVKENLENDLTNMSPIESVPSPQRGFSTWHSTTLTEHQIQVACQRLYSPEQVEGDAPSNMTLEEQNALQRAMTWIKSFIIMPHENLGRPGAVCPYVKPAIREKLMYLTVCPLPETPTEDDIFNSMLIYGNIFQRMEPTEGDLSKLRTIVIALPDIPDEHAQALMEPAHKRLKTELLKHNMLIGQFYPGCQIPGSWNPHFLPLQSPIAMFAIRTFIESDWRFLKGNEEWEDLFKNRFGEAVALNPDTISSHPMGYHGEMPGDH